MMAQLSASGISSRYPILDEEDYSNREYEATIENITNSAWRLKDEYDLPDDWEYEVYGWLSDNDCSEIENTDDQGGYGQEGSRTPFSCRYFGTNLPDEGVLPAELDEWDWDETPAEQSGDQT